MSENTRPSHLTYRTASGDEQCLAFGPDNSDRRIAIIPPLFDEMNRTRRVLVSTMRLLAERGIKTLLPDLPGTNESLAGLAEQDLNSWQAAMTAAADQFEITHIFSLRGGCLIDHPPGLPHWRLAPVKGASLLKTMIRTRIAGDKEAGLSTNSEQLMQQAREAAIELAGNAISLAMIQSLEAAIPLETENVTLAKLGDDSVMGSALWLRAEPQDDPQMAASLAEHIDAWSASCAA